MSSFGFQLGRKGRKEEERGRKWRKGEGGEGEGREEVRFEPPCSIVSGPLLRHQLTEAVTLQSTRALRNSGHACAPPFGLLPATAVTRASRPDCRHCGFLIN